MEITQKGKPPYHIMHSGFKGFEAHGANRDNYREAIELVFDLANAGMVLPGPDRTTPICIIDSLGDVVFLEDNPSDMALLRQIDQAGLLTNLEVVTARTD